MPIKLPKLNEIPAAVKGTTSGVTGRFTIGRRSLGTSIPKTGESKVFLIKTSNRSAGVASLLKKFHLEDYMGKKVALKANYNSVDPFPASTHIETLETIVEVLKEAGASTITLAERSGMGDTRDVLERAGVLALAKSLAFKVVVLDEVDRDGWVMIAPDETHWRKGFYLPRVFLETDKVVQTCCLKTHRFGGHFTLSLKNSVGLVAKIVPGLSYDFMAELHTSPYQRLMIAEVNRFYRVDVVIMDAMKAFISGGPDRGKEVVPNLLLASADRVALDVVGVAILRSYGSTKEVMRGSIFELEQIRRATEIGVGVGSASGIKLAPLNDESMEYANSIEKMLKG